MDANSSNTKRKYQSAMPIIDEGWWESVLAEERQHTPLRPSQRLVKPTTPPPAKPEATPIAEPVPSNWDTLRELYSNDRIVTMKVIAHNRGGLLVENDGLSGFIPFSHLIELAGRESEMDRDVSLESYIGKTLNVKVIECVPEDGRVVFSERAALTESGKRTELFQLLRIGSPVKGTVTNITDFGVFVDLGGVEGLVHISEISWSRVVHPSDLLRPGQSVQVIVLNVDPVVARIALSLKRLRPDPWQTAQERYHPGQLVRGVIGNITPYGAFVVLEEELEGLIHHSELAEGVFMHTRDVVQPGEEVIARVLSVDSPKKRIALSLRGVVDASTQGT